MSDLQRQILATLAASGGSLCLTLLLEQLPKTSTAAHIRRAIERLWQRGKLDIVGTGWAASGPTIVLVPASDAVLPSSGVGRAAQARPEAPS